MATEVAEREEPQRKKFNPLRFYREVVAEARKVHWATRKETTVSTVMVLIMVAAAALFFLLVDFLLKLLVGTLLGIGG